MLENINTILNNNPALLETWQTVALEDILERELIVDFCYVPIDGQALKENLMSLSVWNTGGNISEDCLFY